MSVRNIYVAGPVGGTTDFRERFAKGCEEVRAMGYNPICPLDNGYGDLGPNTVEENWRAYLKRDIRTLLECEGLYAMDQWWDSRGARLEHYIASALGMLVIYQNKVDRRAAGFGASTNTLVNMHRDERS